MAPLNISRNSFEHHLIQNDDQPRLVRNSKNLETNSDQILFVSCYSDFQKLAHGPQGIEAENSIYLYSFEPNGSLVLLNVTGDRGDVINPAFSRFHPRLNVVYTCTENISDNGLIVAYAINSKGELSKIGEVDAGGTSTCYLTIDRAQKHLLAVNYWDSTLVVIPISHETGEFVGGIISCYDPKNGIGMNTLAKKDGGVNHSHNDENTIKMRQADPHSHALVLDPYVGCIAYVPCLGKDVVRELYYDKQRGAIEHQLNAVPSGLCTGNPDGPRYIEIHTLHNVMYVVNELSSTISVFSINKNLIHEINAAAEAGEGFDKFVGSSTLTLIQSIGTIPSAFPRKLNTCGRLCLHNSGRFVVVSNRGHQSIAIFKVRYDISGRGLLTLVAQHHTRGETPRHFQFDSSGQFLIVANQDSNLITIFNFNQCSGEISFTGNEYHVPSPNFVCCCAIHEQNGNRLPGGESKQLENVSSGTNSFDLDKTSLENELAISIAHVNNIRKKLALMNV